MRQDTHTPGAIARIAASLENGETTAERLVAAALARCAELADSINAFAHVDAEGATEAARQSDARRARGEYRGPLDGVPVTVKDNLFVRGLPARWGSRLFRDFVAAEDDIPVERLRAAGAVILGKTATPEFSLGGRTHNLLQGHTRNPLEPRLTPGGSSGGAAASVAAGIVPIALGTDAGGSTRMPASYTGLWGLRPSNGCVPRQRGFPPLALDYQTIGLLAGSLDDLRILLGALGGPDVRDPLSMQMPAMQQTLRRRAALVTAVPGERVDPETAQRAETAAEHLRTQRWSVERRALPCSLQRARSIWGTLTAVSVSRLVKDRARWEDQVTESIRATAERGFRISAHEYAQALDERAALCREISENWGDVDVFLTPTAASPAWPAEEPFPSRIDDGPGHAGSQSIFANWVNAAGYPAISIPVRPHSDGRQIGVQVVSRTGQDHTVLAVAELLRTDRGYRNDRGAVEGRPGLKP